MIRRRLLLAVLIGILAAPQGAFALEANGGIPNVNSLLGYPLTPGNGGVGAMTGGPMWTRWFGDGNEGAGPASGAIALGEHWYTSWTCTGAITTAANVALIVRSQGTVALNTGCSIITGKTSATGDLGGAGGSGGGGAATSTATVATSVINSGSAPTLALSTSAAGSTTAGNDGGVVSAAQWQAVFSGGYIFRPRGGGVGTAGGSTGGAAGGGGAPIIIIAPTITIASGVTLDASGAPGVAPAANSTGAGGGGGGGVIWLVSESFTNSGGIFKYGGGPGGAITQPSIQAVGGGCDTTGCGTDAFFTVTGLTTGGLDKTKITIANGGSGYKVAPTCQVNVGTSGLTGSPACHFTVAGGAITDITIDTAGSGGVLTTFTTTFVGGYGANGDYLQELIQ